MSHLLEEEAIKRIKEHSEWGSVGTLGETSTVSPQGQKKELAESPVHSPAAQAVASGKGARCYYWCCRLWPRFSGQRKRAE